MTTREQFKVAFLKTCADQGMSVAQTVERVQEATSMLEKQAFWAQIASMLAGLGKGVAVDLPLGVLKTMGPPLMAAGAIAGVGIPLGAGVLGGAALQRMTSDDVNVTEAKANELIEQYNREAERAKNNSAMQQYQSKVLPHVGRR